MQDWTRSTDAWTWCGTHFFTGWLADSRCDVGPLLVRNARMLFRWIVDQSHPHHQEYQRYGSFDVEHGLPPQRIHDEAAQCETGHCTRLRTFKCTINTRSIYPIKKKKNDWTTNRFNFQLQKKKGVDFNVDFAKLRTNLLFKELTSKWTIVSLEIELPA